MLVLTRREGESIVIGDDIVIKVAAVEDGKVKLGIEAPRDVSIHRYEVYLSIQEENRKAAAGRKISLGELDEVIKKEK